MSPLPIVIDASWRVTSELVRLSRVQTRSNFILYAMRNRTKLVWFVCGCNSDFRSFKGGPAVRVLISTPNFAFRWFAGLLEDVASRLVSRTLLGNNIRFVRDSFPKGSLVLSFLYCRRGIIPKFGCTLVAAFQILACCAVEILGLPFFPPLTIEDSYRIVLSWLEPMYRPYFAIILLLPSFLNTGFMFRADRNRLPLWAVVVGVGILPFVWGLIVGYGPSSCRHM